MVFKCAQTVGLYIRFAPLVVLHLISVSCKEQYNSVHRKYIISRSLCQGVAKFSANPTVLKGAVYILYIYSDCLVVNPAREAGGAEPACTPERAPKAQCEWGADGSAVAGSLARRKPESLSKSASTTANLNSDFQK